MSMGGQTDSCGPERVESIWPTSEADRRLQRKSLSSCINVLIHFFCLHQHSSSSASPPRAPPFPLTSSPSHLNICLAVWWLPGCLTVSPMKRPTICSVVHNTLETARTYGWEGQREKERQRWPDEHLYLPSGTRTGLLFAKLRCHPCTPPTTCHEKYLNRWNIPGLK